MVSCYDCEHFGVRCLGIVPPMDFRDRIDQHCAMYRVVQWRHELYKPGGQSRL